MERDTQEVEQVQEILVMDLEEQHLVETAWAERVQVMEEQVEPETEDRWVVHMVHSPLLMMREVVELGQPVMVVVVMGEQEAVWLGLRFQEQLPLVEILQ